MSRFWMGLLLIGVLLCGLWFPAAAQVYEQEMPADWQEKDVLRITAFAVGEGDALLLQCGGESMMVDGGPKPFRDPMKAAMEQRGIRHFKYLLNTHSHDDHIDGLYYLMLNGFTADEYLHPYTEWWARADKELHGRTIQLTEKLGIPNRQVGEGDTLTLGGAELEAAPLHQGEQHQCQVPADQSDLRTRYGAFVRRYYRPCPEGFPDPACPGRPESGRDQDSPSRHHAGGARFPDRRQPGVRYRDQLRG
ncbi:MAG: MBL fold metallo-hydrolase [Lachnospiraceae bacterium]